nr:ORF22 [Bracoviriform inaniti]
MTIKHVGKSGLRRIRVASLNYQKSKSPSCPMRAVLPHSSLRTLSDVRQTQFELLNCYYIDLLLHSGQSQKQAIWAARVED